jgi:hypothetical protein
MCLPSAIYSPLLPGAFEQVQARVQAHPLPCLIRRYRGGKC